MAIKQIQYQSVFPANFKPPAPAAAHPTLYSMEPVKAVATAAAVLAATFNFFVVPQPPPPPPYKPGIEASANQVNFKTFTTPDWQAYFPLPPLVGPAGFTSSTINTPFIAPDWNSVSFKPVTATGATYKPGSESYTNQINFRTIVGPQDTAAHYRPPNPYIPVTGYQSYDNQINFRTIIRPESGVASIQPPAATPAVYKPGSESYNNQINFQTVIRPELGQELFKPPPQPTGFQSYDNQINFRTVVGPQDGQALARFASINPPANTTGFLSYDNLVVNRTFVRPESGLSISPLRVLPTGFQSYDNQINFRTVVGPQDGQALYKPVVVPGAVFQAGSDTYNNQINFQTIVRLEIGQLLFKPPGPTQLPTGFGSWENYFFAKPNPLGIHIELSPFIPALPSVPPSTIPSGDGPPWHLTQKEIKRLLHYRAELAALQNAYDVRRRQEVEELLRDVNLAAGREVEALPAIEAKIRQLPALPKKSLFSLDLKELKKSVEQNAIQRELDEDEYEVSLLLEAMFS